EAAGYRVRIPRGQGCCGALAWHYGDPDAARHLLRRNLRAFAGGERPIVVTAAGCGAALREAGEWLERNDPDRAGAGRLARRVRDLSEALDERASNLRWRPIDLSVSYQDACHLKQVQGVSEPPRRLLRSIPSLDLRETDEAPNCCGSAGIYSFLEPEVGARLAKETLAAHIQPGVSRIVTSNAGCLLHLRLRARGEGRRIGVLHTAELLDMALDDEPSGRSPTAGRCS
ncbi:MAG: (Fe-S)-binding protein, partial [Candidatus Eisenbacteria bacterium]|nr:(Fe-S)-binding protein [Candidatus Eisenbacteria bacterium]